MPSGASKHASSCLGIYKKRTEFSTCAFVAGRPTYAEFYGKDRYLWFAPASKHWLIGTLEALGTEMGCIFVPDDQAMTPDEITGRWWAIKPNSKLFVPAPDVRLYTLQRSGAASSSAAADDVSIVSVVTPEQRNAAGKRNAIDLDSVSSMRRPNKMPKTELQATVAKARKTIETAAEKRMDELALSAMKEFMADKIDEVELKRRKAEAREAAETEKEKLEELDELFGNYKGLVQDRVKVEEKFEKTLEKAEKEIAKYHELEDKAEEMVQAAAAELLPGEAGPSGVKAEK